MNTRSAGLGPKLTEVLTRAWRDPFSTRSDFARYNADWIAVAASRGFLTNLCGPTAYGRRWLITPRGLAGLFREFRK